jgi:uncharacterized protein (DUF305 family)
MRTRIAAAALLLALGACTTPAPQQAPPPTRIAPSAIVFGTDIAWAQLTLALNQKALQYLSLVPERAADARLVALAQQLSAGHTDEDTKLDAFLRQIGAPTDNPHAGMAMPGMATAEQITAMAAARGDAFDKLFVTNLRAHLTQCQNLAHSMSQSGKHPDAIALATTIESTRQQALTQLAPWPAPSAQP